MDFNLFTGHLAVHSLVTRHNSKSRLEWVRASLEIAWRPVFQKRIRLDAISLHDAEISIIQEPDGDLFVGGIRVRSGGPSSGTGMEKNGQRIGDWQIGFGAIDLKDVVLKYQAPGIRQQLTQGLTQELTIDQAHIDPVQSWNPDATSDFSFSLSLGSGRIRGRGTARPYARTAEISGTIDSEQIPIDWLGPFLNIPNLQGRLAAETDFAFSWGPHPELSTQGTWQLQNPAGNHTAIRFKASDIGWDGSLHLTLPGREDAPLRMTAEGALTADNLAGTFSRVRLRPTTLKWQGSSRLALGATTEDEPQLRLNGSVAATSFNLLLTTAGLEASGNRLQAEGELVLQSGQTPESTQWRLNVPSAGGRNLRLIDSQAHTTLGRIEALDLEEFQMQDNQLKTTLIQADGAAFLEHGNSNPEKQARILTAGRIELRRVEIDPGEKNLQIGSLSVGQLEGRVVRNRDGRFEIPHLGPQAGEATQTKNKEASGWDYIIYKAEVDNGSSLRFQDESVDPPADLTFTQLEFQVTELDSTRPEAPSPVALKTTINESAHLSAEGTIRPLAPNISLDINGQLQHFALPQIRGYPRQYWGYTIRSGQLNADFHLQIDNAVLDSAIEAKVIDLNMERLTPEEEDEFTQSLGMPLNTALDLIRDSDRSIRLKLPVTGSLDDPRLDIAGVIGKALQNATYKAVKTAALTYFAPLGAVYVASKLFGRAVALRLDPVFFQPGQARLDADMRKHLDQVADKLKDRPDVRLLLCGKSTPADRSALEQAASEAPSTDADSDKKQSHQNQVGPAELRRLAQNRARAIRGHLISHSIDIDRLVLCAPEIVADRDMRPQVELAI